MLNTFTLQDVYGRPESLRHDDPLVRISAIHHAGNKLRRAPSPKLRDSLAALLQDQELLVSRYAAVTLAQCGEDIGIHHLVQAIIAARGADDELNDCLRNCRAFPFAVLLNERIALDSVREVAHDARRQFVERMFNYTADRFYETAARDPKWREDFLNLLITVDQAVGLRLRPNRVLDRGRVLSVPMGKQPGFLCCPNRGLFFQFHDESALDRDTIATGAEVLFVADLNDTFGEVDCVYVLEDSNLLTDGEIYSQLLTRDIMRVAATASPMQPGVVISKYDSAHVVCADGTDLNEYYRANKSNVRQFVLVQKTNELGKPQCHFVPRVFLTGDPLRDIVVEFTKQRGYVRGRINEIRSDAENGWQDCVLQIEQGAENPGSPESPD